MSSELYKQLIEAIDKDTVYDFLANNNWRLDGKTASRIAMEVLWVYSEAIKNGVSLEEANKELKQNLKDAFEE